MQENKTTKYLVSWKSSNQRAKRKEATFNDLHIAEEWYDEKLSESKSPFLYVIEYVESTKKLK